MKKFAASIAAVVLTFFGSSAAHAALTSTPTGENSAVYVISDNSGDISRLDLADESTELVCESTITSDNWITGSAFDPATNTVYWVKNFATGSASIVTVDMYTCDQSEAPIDLGGRGDTSNASIYGMTWYEGGIELLYEDGDVYYDRIRGEASLVDGVWEVTQVDDYGNEVNFSDIAYDPVSDDLYAIAYDCNVYNLANYPGPAVAAYSVAGVSQECPTLKFDDSGRIWFTSDDAGMMNSDTIDIPGDDLQSLEGSLNFGIYCEEFFFAPTSFEPPSEDDGLADTGFDVNLGTVFGTAGLLFVAAAALTYRARRRD